jgi:homoserine dehydrogenase
MRKVNIVLMGYGNVGQAFVELVQKKNEDCQKRYGLDIYFVGIFRSRRSLVFAHPQKPAEFLPVQWREGGCLSDILERYSPGVLVETTPTDSQTGGPGLGYIHLALEKGWHVVTANKGPLVVDFQNLKEKARNLGTSLKFSGATAAALPTIDVALRSLAGARISSIEGILNGTTNYILKKMGEGFPFESALREAQARGIAETDPSQDVEGWDTAYKILLLTNAVFDTSFNLADVQVEGIDKIDTEHFESCKKRGEKLKLLGRMKRRGDKYSLCVELTPVNATHPLFNVDGTEKGITFETDTMSSITVIGGKSDPIGTAAALLKDIINIYLPG